MDVKCEESHSMEMFYLCQTLWSYLHNTGLLNKLTTEGVKVQ